MSIKYYPRFIHPTKGKAMPRCIICNTTQAIVHSGVDALLLGTPQMVEKVCYPCAKKEGSK
jgi:hypothetical protein